MDLNDRKENARAAYIRYIKANGGRITPERLMVLEQMVVLGRFSMDDLEEQMKALHFTISRATLYNITHHLMTAGLVIKLPLGKVVKYQFCDQRSSRMHMICMSCGKIIAFKDSPLEDMILQTRSKRFEPRNYALSLYGMCSTCQAKKERKENNKKIK